MMNIYVTLKCLLCCAILALLSSLAQAEDKYVVTDKTKASDKSAPIEVKDADAPLIPVPEPSAVSLILLSVGGVMLLLRMRKRA